MIKFISQNLILIFLTRGLRVARAMLTSYLREGNEKRTIDYD